MKIKLFVSTLLLSIFTTFNGVAVAQTLNNVNILSSNQETEKINNIKKLLEITGTKQISQQITTQMLANMKSNLPQVPQKFWDSLQEEINYDEMLEQIIPIYSKYFTNEEIKGMLDFYETPLGKKTIRVMPQIMQESVQIGQTYGKKVAERVINKLEAEGYLRRP
ncbi:MAG: DUF2059 domain-containing protein [Nostocaceae cyanobacterium]|nr:DUF2059 domain-containing protein [Nostocaceae cyanobacterium]